MEIIDSIKKKIEEQAKKMKSKGNTFELSRVVYESDPYELLEALNNSVGRFEDEKNYSQIYNLTRMNYKIENERRRIEEEEKSTEEISAEEER